MTPTVAMASEFLDAYVHIPAAQQKKVGDFIKKFRRFRLRVRSTTRA